MIHIKGRKYIIAGICAIISVMLFSLGILDRYEVILSDSFFQYEQPLNGDIAVIGIDTKSLDELGPFNTWSRSYMADVINNLNYDDENRPAVIGVDVMYFGNTTLEADNALVSACVKRDNVVLSSLADFSSKLLTDNNGNFYMDNNYIDKFEEPFEDLKSVTLQGHINTVPDEDGIVRRSLQYVTLQDGRKINSFAYEIYKKYAEFAGLTDESMPPLKNDTWYIPYSAKPGGYYDGYSFVDVMKGNISPEVFANRIVLIGPYASGLMDNYMTSIDHDTQMYGVEVHANVIDALINGKFKQEIPSLAEKVLIFVIVFISTILFSKLKLKHSLIYLASLSIGYVGIVCLMYHFAGIIMDVLYIPISVIIVFVLMILERYIKALTEQQKLKAELGVAKRIQTGSLERDFDKFNIEVYATMEPAKAVGGDMYDVIKIDDNHVGILIADVSGKGISASLFMLMAKTIIKNFAQMGMSAHEVLERANDALCEGNDANMFVTAFFGILDTETGDFVYANAGHNPPVIYNEEKYEWLNVTPGFVLAGMENMMYKEASIKLTKDNMIFLYTDGVTEAQNVKSELFSDARLLNILNSGKGEISSVKDILKLVRVGISDFVKKAEQADDITMLAFRLK